MAERDWREIMWRCERWLVGRPRRAGRVGLEIAPDEVAELFAAVTAADSVAAAADD